MSHEQPPVTVDAPNAEAEKPARPPSYAVGGIALVLGGLLVFVALLDGPALGVAVTVAVWTERAMHGRSTPRVWSTMISGIVLAHLAAFVVLGDPTRTEEILTAIATLSTAAGTVLLWTPASQRFVAASDAHHELVEARTATGEPGTGNRPL